MSATDKTTELTEQQLSELFKKTRKVNNQADLDDLQSYSQASDARLQATETIADNNLLSAGQQLLHKLSTWTQFSGQDIEKSIQNKSGFNLFSWLKPGLLALSFVTTVVFLNPDLSQQVQTQVNDKIMFDSSFEGSANNTDQINNVSFDSGVSLKQDVISNSSFS